MKNKTVVITGGAGFIGSNLAIRLSEDNKIIIIDDLSTGILENIAYIIQKSNVEFIRGSIMDRNLLDKAFKGIDFVFHEAALPSVTRSIEDPLSSNEVNITGTLNVLMSARDNQARKVIFASSSSVYGDAAVLPKKENMPPNTLSPYALTKLVGEYYCNIFHKIYNLPTICLRYFNVYGPRQNPDSEYAAVIPRFITSALNHKKPVIYGDGNQTRDFTFIEDVVQANIIAAESDATGVFNIGSGSQITIKALLGNIAAILNRNIVPVYEEPRPGDIRDSLADITLARSIGYNPIHNLDYGLRKTIKSFSKSN